MENCDQWPPLLSEFILPDHDFNNTAINFKWIEEDKFSPEMIFNPCYSPLVKKWIAIYTDGKEQIFSQIDNDTWTVFYSAERGNALGIGPKQCLFDIFSAALDLAYIKLSIENHFLAIHSAGIVISGKCLLLIAISGGGKSTLSGNAIKRGYEVLSDDRIIVSRDDIAGYLAYGTPFGRVGMNKGGFPIAGIFLLQKSDHDRAEPISKMDVFEEVWYHEYKRRRKFFGGNSASSFFPQFMDFLNEHPTFRLHFRKDFDDWEYLSQVVESANISSTV